MSKNFWGFLNYSIPVKLPKCIVFLAEIIKRVLSKEMSEDISTYYGMFDKKEWTVGYCNG